MTSQIESARENARRTDGRFGIQPHAETTGITLGPVPDARRCGRCGRDSNIRENGLNCEHCLYEEAFQQVADEQFGGHMPSRQYDAVVDDVAAVMEELAYEDESHYRARLLLDALGSGREIRVGSTMLRREHLPARDADGFPKPSGSVGYFLVIPNAAIGEPARTWNWGIANGEPGYFETYEDALAAAAEDLVEAEDGGEIRATHDQREV